MQQERERAQRIAEGEAAEAATLTPRQQERERLSSLLTPLGLAIRDITPDGHCLYAAVSDQLSVRMKIKVSLLGFILVGGCVCTWGELGDQGSYPFP